MKPPTIIDCGHKCTRCGSQTYVVEVECCGQCGEPKPPPYWIKRLLNWELEIKRDEEWKHLTGNTFTR